MTIIGRPVIWNTFPGIVTAHAGKLITVKLADREVKCRAEAVTFTDTAPLPDTDGKVTFGPEDRDYYGDQERMFSRLKS